MDFSTVFFKNKKRKEKKENCRKKILKKKKIKWPKIVSLSLHTQKTLNAQKVEEDKTVVWAAVKKSCVICGFNQTDKRLVQIFLL